MLESHVPAYDIHNFVILFSFQKESENGLKMINTLKGPRMYI